MIHEMGLVIGQKHSLPLAGRQHHVVTQLR